MIPKTRRSGRPVQSTYPSFPDNDKLCQVTTLQHYKNRTASLRARYSRDNPLFYLIISLSNQLAQLPLQDG